MLIFLFVLNVKTKSLNKKQYSYSIIHIIHYPTFRLYPKYLFMFPSRLLSTSKPIGTQLSFPLSSAEAPYQQLWSFFGVWKFCAMTRNRLEEKLQLLLILS